MIDLIDLTTQLNSWSIRASRGELSLEDEKRQSLMKAAEKLAHNLETPVEKTHRWMYGLHPATAVRVASEMGIFNEASRAEGGTVTLDELGSATKADPVLLLRVMRFLVAIDVFSEEGVHCYVANPVASYFVTNSVQSNALLRYHSVHAKTMVAMPDYLKQTQYQNPDKANDGPFQFAFDTHLHHFEWLKKHPRQHNAFNVLMGIQRTGNAPEWFEYYPVVEKGIKWCQENKHEGALLVDVGGGLGHDIKNFREHFPHAIGEGLVIQDLPEVVEDAAKDLEPEIETMAHNFFKRQPVRGARFYYMRTIMHDWPNSACRKILTQLRESMTVDSILLLNEFVLPNSQVALAPILMDWSMMAMYSGQERTRDQWLDLLESAGFTMKKIWTSGANKPGEASLIEAVVSECEEEPSKDGV